MLIDELLCSRIDGALQSHLYGILEMFERPNFFDLDSVLIPKKWRWQETYRFQPQLNTLCSHWADIALFSSYLNHSTNNIKHK